MDSSLNDTNIHPTLEMMALDELPTRIRIALNYAAAKHSAVEVLGLIRKGRDEDEVFNIILQTDRAMMAGLING